MNKTIKIKFLGKEVNLYFSYDLNEFSVEDLGINRTDGYIDLSFMLDSEKDKAAIEKFLIDYIK